MIGRGIASFSTCPVRLCNRSFWKKVFASYKTCLDRNVGYATYRLCYVFVNPVSFNTGAFTNSPPIQLHILHRSMQGGGAKNQVGNQQQPMLHRNLLFSFFALCSTYKNEPRYSNHC